MGALKKGLSILAIILMMASIIGYTGLSFLSPGTYSYRGTQTLGARSALYIPLHSSSHLSGTLSAPSPINVYLLDGDSFDAMKRGAPFNSLGEWEGTSIEVDVDVPAGRHYLVILNPGGETSVELNLIEELD
ncbi:hypothetical protein [Palaeococcus ferrophilus]|uniref:hypothetical protein n=1 Tax=Palaeococcus ferrophilus TaxID=83868 RepID=UPI00064FF417|nr:hypothetical protein [Palaeococcus ferrophilus]